MKALLEFIAAHRTNRTYPQIKENIDANVVSSKIETDRTLIAKVLKACFKQSGSGLKYLTNTCVKSLAEPIKVLSREQIKIQVVTATETEE